MINALIPVSLDGLPRLGRFEWSLYFGTMDCMVRQETLSAQNLSALFTWYS